MLTWLGFTTAFRLQPPVVSSTMLEVRINIIMITWIGEPTNRSLLRVNTDEIPQWNEVFEA